MKLFLSYAQFIFTFFIWDFCNSDDDDVIGVQVSVAIGLESAFRQSSYFSSGTHGSASFQLTSPHLSPSPSSRLPRPTGRPGDPFVQQ